MTDSAPRAPRPPVREEGRRLTVRRCVEAAGDLFVAHGYTATTIDAVAERAGVARRTVFTAVGGKVALLKLAYDWSLVGDDEPVPMSDRPEIHAIAAQDSPRRAIALWAEHVAVVAGRSNRMLFVLQAAADADPEAAALYAKAMADARFGASMFVRHVLSIAPQAGAVDPERATDLVWGLLDPGVYARMVLHGAWTESDFASWLSSTFAQFLLDAPTQVD